jgi:hypothetical protein
MSIRLLLVRLPRLLADLVIATFAGESGIRVETMETDRELTEVVAAVRDGVIITAVDDLTRFTAECARGVGQREPVLVGITADGRQAWLMELTPRSLGQPSPAGLRAAVAEALRASAP